MTNPGPPAPGGPSPARARELWRLLEPLHAVTYFSPEPLAALSAAGCRGFWMGYFAGRAAPLGQASAELVHATFYNFSREHVDRAVPDAWRYVAPAAALAARLDGSVAALRRIVSNHVGDGASSEVARAAELATRAALSAPVGGRPLYAANRALPLPDGDRDPWALLWHAATLLREHRGDGHVAGLVGAGVSGREAHVLHALATGTPRPVYEAARRLDDPEWQRLTASLTVRGLVDEAGMLTPAGRETKAHVEQVTDELAATAYSVLSEAELDALVEALRPLAAAVVRAGEIPVRSPMGLDLEESTRGVNPGR